MTNTLNVAIIGEYNQHAVTHTATNDALHHAAAALGTGVDIQWVPTDTLARDLEQIQHAEPNTPSTTRTPRACSSPS